MNALTANLNGLPAPSEGPELRHIIERYLRDPAIDLGKLEKMVELQERMTRWNAETAFNNAMAAAQAQMRPVAVDSVNPQTRSKYASYAAMDAALRPIYSEHGFALSFNTAEGAPEGSIRIVCDVSRGGHTKRFQIDMASDGKGARGGEVMTRTHAMGSAASYGMRYLLKMIFNVAVGEGDDDGNAASRRGNTQIITEEQAATIRDLLDFLPDDTRAKFMQLAGTEQISAILAHKYDRAVKWLKERMEQQ